MPENRLIEIEERLNKNRDSEDDRAIFRDFVEEDIRYLLDEIKRINLLQYSF